MKAGKKTGLVVAFEAELDGFGSISSIDVGRSSRDKREV